MWEKHILKQEMKSIAEHIRQQHAINDTEQPGVTAFWIQHLKQLERKLHQCTLTFHQHLPDDAPAFHGYVTRDSPPYFRTSPCHVLIMMIRKMTARATKTAKIWEWLCCCFVIINEYHGCICAFCHLFFRHHLLLTKFTKFKQFTFCMCFHLYKSH